MSYRKIAVDGTEYLYTVGRTHLKVKGLPAVLITEVGSREQILCRCCGEQLQPHDWTYRVHPSDVKHYIQDEVKNVRL